MTRSLGTIRARAIEAMISLASSSIVLRRLIREVWHAHRRDIGPKRKT